MIKIVLLVVVILFVGYMINDLTDVNGDKLVLALDNQTNLFNSCLNDKSILQTAKNSINLQNINNINTINTLNKQIVGFKANQTKITLNPIKNCTTITPINNTYDSTYILMLIKQVKRLELIADGCTFYNQTERELELDEDLDECNDKLKEIKSLI